MTTSSSQTALTDFLQALAHPSPPPTPITPAHIHLIAQSLLPSAPKSDRSLAYICLTKIVEDASTLGAERDSHLTRIFQPTLEVFTGASEDSTAYLPPAALLSAVFPLAPAVASGLLLAPLSDEDEAPDPLAVLLEMAELESPLQLALAELLVAAAGTKQGREMIQSRAMEWLVGATALRGDGKLAGVACAALAKLRNDASGSSSDPTELVDKMFISLSRSLDSPSTVLAIIEGLSVLSLRPATKHLLANHPEYLSKIFGLLPTPPRGGSLPVRSGSTAVEVAYEPVDTSLAYGISTVLVNLSSRKPVLSAEDEQMAKLRRMAEVGQAGGRMGTGAETPSDTLEEAPAVQARVGRLYKAGVVSVLGRLGRADSLLVRQMVGKLCLNLVEDKERRMEFIREGGYKVLSEVTRKLMVANEGDETGITPTITEIDILPALQANAKLIITTPPNLLFPPPHLTTSLNALTPLYTLLTHPRSSLLQTFEALMGLTNLASIAPDIADRIVLATITPKGGEQSWPSSSSTPAALRVISRVEEGMMEENELVRRASTELVCNLAGCEKGFTYLTGESGEGKGRVKQRLTVLLVLTDVEDLPTRLAAGGALAVLTESPRACAAILEVGEGRSAWKRLVSLLQPEEVEEEGEKIALISTQGPDEGMVLRAGCILLNLLQYVQGLKGEEREREGRRVEEDGVGEALRGVQGSVGEEVKGVIGECLRLLKGL